MKCCSYILENNRKLFLNEISNQNLSRGLLSVLKQIFFFDETRFQSIWLAELLFLAARSMQNEIILL